MTTIDEVLAKEADAWARLEAAVQAVPADRRNDGEVVPGWSTQVLFWHCIFWADYVAQVVEAAAGDLEPPGDDDWDAVNDQVAADGASMAWDDVIAAGERTRARVRDAIASLRPEQLTEDLLGEISGETYEHYDEHATEIAAFAAS
ncbi:MAG TPA: DinB family protein [Actinomycetota bacterium]